MNALADILIAMGFAMPGAAWLWRMLGFVLIWAVELFLVQSYTLVSAQDNAAQFVRWASRVRFLIDLCFVTAISVLLPVGWLVGVSVLAMLVHVGLISYFQYFRRPLSALSLYHWREGTKASSHRFPTHPRVALVVLGAVLAAKSVLLLNLPADDGLGRQEALTIFVSAVAGYMVLNIIANRFDPLNRILTTRGIGRLGLIRGYLVTWLAEFYYLGQRQVLESAVKQREIVSDRLTSREAPIPIRRQLIIIQAESLDYNVLNSTRNGREVTPFLNQLWEKSLHYRIAAPRYIGSADADFVMLNGVMPSMHMITYNIPNYPYENTLPQFLKAYGYQTSIYHGNTGNFYNRRAAFERMGFANILFEEEMVLDKNLPQIGWGIEDRHVFRLSSEALEHVTDGACHVIITLTTHTPYTLVSRDGQNREIFENPQSMAQDYLNSMRYLDDQLREYIGSLKSATVLIFSDHSADPAVAPEFKPDCQDNREFVPCMIYDTDADLGALQRTRGEVASDGQLTLLDISSYLRAQVTSANKTDSALAVPAT